MLKKIIVIIFILFFTALAAAGNKQEQWLVKGRVKNISHADFSDPIKYAVTIDTYHIEIDSNGLFQCFLHSPGTYKAILKQGLLYIDEQSFTLREGVYTHTIDFIIPEEKEIAKLPDIYVTERLKQESAHRIYGKEIALDVGLLNDPVRMIGNLPGATAQSEVNARPVIRGGDVLETRVVLDNIPLIQPYHFGGAKSFLNISAIDNMELYYEWFPAEFPNAQSGLIMINTKKENSSEFDLEADLNLLQYNIYTRIPIFKEKTGLFLTSQGTLLNWSMHTFSKLGQIVSDPFNNSSRTLLFTFPDYRDVSAGFKFDFSEDSHLFINGLASIDRFNFMFTDTLYTHDYYIADTVLNEDSYDRNPFTYWPDPVRLYSEDSSKIYYPDSAILKKEQVLHDTVGSYVSGYYLIYGIYGLNITNRHAIEVTAGYQGRDWFLDNVNPYNAPFLYLNYSPRFGREDLAYVINRNQYHLNIDWSGLLSKKMTYKSGVQYQLTDQTYNVLIQRYIHDIILSGNTLAHSMWGAATLDSGLTIKFPTLQDSTSAYDLFKAVLPSVYYHYKGSHVFSNMALYLENAYHINPKLLLKSGLRLEGTFEDSSIFLSPRLAAEYQFDNKHKLTGGGGLYAQNNYEVAYSALIKTLKPEKVGHLFLGWFHKPSKKFKQRVSAYYKYYYDLIMDYPDEAVYAYDISASKLSATVSELLQANNINTSDYEIEQWLETLEEQDPEQFREWQKFGALYNNVNSLTYSNTGTGHAMGIEYFFTFKPAELWKATLSAAYSHSSRKRAPDLPAHPFPLERPVVLTLSNFFTIKKGHELAVKYKYASGLPYTNMVYNSEGLTIGPFNEERFSPYMRLDIRFSKRFRFFGHNGYWYTEIWNALNTPNMLLRDQETEDIISIEYNMPVTVFFTGIKFKW
jgi:hypothetical protein